VRRVSPEERGFRAGGLAAADTLLEAAVRDRAFPGAVVAVGRDDALVHLRAFGHLTYASGAEPVAEDTIYDLASLTKIVATTTMAMMLVDEGRLSIDDRVSQLVPEFSGGAKDSVTLRHLLAHAGGIEAWLPLHRELSGAEAYVREVARLDLTYEPGTRSLYSDLGFILLGAALERAAGERIDAFAATRILGPLGMADTRYLPPAGWRPRIAPTEEDPWRLRVLRGEVHDENAHAMGGVAGHAGLFGTAADLSRLALMVLNEGRGENGPLVASETLARFLTPSGFPDSSYALGWDMPSGESSSAGRLFSRRSVGHLGYAGTSIWIDLERRLFLILLTNRVHPRRGNDAIKRVRPALADAVAGAFAG
jgi:CubicO group peptidase (beta-lactamase class C family)